MKPKPQLSYEEWLEIMTDPRSNAEVARAYKRSIGNVSQIRSGKVYKSYYRRFQRRPTSSCRVIPPEPPVHWTITQPWEQRA